MTVTTSTIGGTVLITIDRPPVNALDLDTIVALERTFAEVAREDPPGGIVLTGGGKVFSAGVDTRAFMRYDRDERRALALAITRMVARLLEIRTAVVAAINGHALGGGFVLMLACDYRIAVHHLDTRLGMPEVIAGIPFPAGPLEIMRHELHPELLRRLALGGEVLNPQELLEADVLDDLCVDKDVAAQAIELARNLSSQPGFRAVKQQIRGGLAKRLADLAAAGEDAFLSEFERDPSPLNDIPSSRRTYRP
jgi:enoyl-CoA hydratase